MKSQRSLLPAVLAAGFLLLLGVTSSFASELRIDSKLIGGASGDGGLPPSIQYVNCFNVSGSGTFLCTVGYSSVSPATIRWNNGSTDTYYLGFCNGRQGFQFPVTATVTNAYGSASGTRVYTCPF